MGSIRIFRIYSLCIGSLVAVLSALIATIPVFAGTGVLDCYLSALKNVGDPETVSFRDVPLDGNAPIPQNLRITFKYGEKPYIMQTSNARNWPKPFRALFQNLQRKSVVPATGDYREFGAWVIEFKDGTRKTARFTSNLVREIQDQHMLRAFKGSGIQELIKSNPTSVQRVYWIHTHPTPAIYKKEMGEPLDNISFSDWDVKAYETFTSSIQNITGHHIPFTGIVLPNCTYCDDLVFTMTL